MKKQKCSFFVLFSLLMFCSIGLAFAFPSDSYAMDSFSSPNDSNSFSSSAVMYGGCLYTGYDLGFSTDTNPDNNLVIFLGSNTKNIGLSGSSSSLYNCGYRWTNNNLSYYQHASALTRTLAYTSGVVSTDTYATTSGSTNIVTNYNSNFNDFNFDLYNQIEEINVTINSQNDTAFHFPILDSSLDDVSTYALVMYSLDMPNSSADVGTSVQIGAQSFNVSHSDLSLETLQNYVNDSFVKYCGTPTSGSDESNILSLFEYDHTAPEGYTTCYFFFGVPLSSSGYVDFYNNRTFHIVAADASRYSKQVFTTTDGLVLPYYGYPWGGIFRSPSYKTMNARYDESFKYINPYFKVIWPETVEEATTLGSGYLKLDEINSNARAPFYEQNNGSENYPSNSTVMGWFNVFDLSGIIFPFSAFYTSFVNPVESCVSIPILSSWLHLDTQQYCTWWPSTVINTLTPIFTIIPMMLLFGFVVSWLRGDRAYSVFQDGGGMGTIHTSVGGKA